VRSLAISLLLLASCADDTSAVPPGPTTTPCTLEVLLDDAFGDGDLAAGGTNGGFVMRSNGLIGDSTVTDVDGVARISADGRGVGGEPDIGMGSINTFDATVAAAAGLTVVWQFSHADVPIWTGLGAYLVGTDTFYENSPAMSVRIAGEQTDVFASYQAGFEVHSGPLHAYQADAYEQAALADGFTAILELTAEGWAYRLNGLGASALRGSGAWETGFNYTDVLDADSYVGAAIQGDNSDSAPRVLDLDRVSVLAGLCPAGQDPTLP
jgi:hypothetical protein